MPNLYIIAGCNGAGKTLASYAMFPEMLDCKEFVNADEIAKGISPFQPEKASIAAGRVMLKHMEDLVEQRETFALETTLATRSYAKFVQKVQKLGYHVTLLYFWLDSVELALRRVAKRVELGGHDVAEEVVRRRYKAGIKNLFSLYVPICDYWLLIDNSTDPFQLIAEGNKENIQAIHHEDIFNYLYNYPY